MNELNLVGLHLQSQITFPEILTKLLVQVIDYLLVLASSFAEPIEQKKLNLCSWLFDIKLHKEVAKF